jgi:hypothetical protein
LALRAPAPSEQESVGALVSRLGSDVTRIVRAEIHLVQLRLAAALRVVKAGGSGLAVAAVMALGGIGALVAGLVLLLALVLPTWAAALAVGGGLLLVGAVLGLIEVRVVAGGVGEALGPLDAEERLHGE